MVKDGQFTCCPCIFPRFLAFSIFAPHFFHPKISVDWLCKWVVLATTSGTMVTWHQGVDSKVVGFKDDTFPETNIGT